MPQVTERAPLPTQPTAKVAPITQKQPNIAEGAQVPSQEATPQVAAAPDPISVKLAAMARREKAIQERDGSIKEREALVKAELKRLDEQREEIRKQAQAEIRARLKQDPFGFLSEEGLTGEQLFALQANQSTPESQKLTALEQKIAQLEQDKIAAQESNYQAARKQAVADISMIVQASQEFEVIKALGLEEQVVAKLEDTFNKTGVIPDHETACREIEAEYFPMALEIAKLAKIQKALQTASPESASMTPEAMKQVPIQKPQQAPMSTLSNRQAPVSGKGLTWAERRARAIAVAEGRAV